MGSLVLGYFCQPHCNEWPAPHMCDLRSIQSGCSRPSVMRGGGQGQPFFPLNYRLSYCGKTPSKCLISTRKVATIPIVQYQMEMMRSLRHVNIDHLHVGWYQSTYYGTFVSRALLDSQFSYQHAIEESVVLIYEKILMNAINLARCPQIISKASIAYEHMFEEVPIVIKDSHLINVLIWELDKKAPVAEKHELLSLSSSNHLEKSLQLLMDRVDEMSQDIVKYNTYLRNASKQQQQKHQYIQRRQQENIQRQSRGEPSLPEEDVSKLFKPPVPPPRMDSLLISGQINTYIQNIKEFTSQNLGKLFMAEALQDQAN
ncbi:hypothetical protein GDO78_012338 [Eleutherodactylus coqui]|uniref:Eukaryotic translation initiation factor 3 subunit 3 n=1 Tax=Eleutherodactylus coqui TaxID=57060 RepID=A0A8J6F081_ELECQ|nr:hypothetical protein GDO78_012338 [Eleutherodactylus coqui]